MSEELPPADSAAISGDAKEREQPQAAPSTIPFHTFLIADIRGSTSYTVEHGDEAWAALAMRFAQIAHEVARGGTAVSGAARQRATTPQPAR